MVRGDSAPKRSRRMRRKPAACFTAGFFLCHRDIMIFAKDADREGQVGGGAGVWRSPARSRTPRIAPRRRSCRSRAQGLRPARLSGAAPRSRGRQGRSLTGGLAGADRLGIGADDAPQCGAPGARRRRHLAAAGPHLQPQRRALCRRGHRIVGHLQCERVVPARRQAGDRDPAVPKSDRRSRSGIFRGRHRRGDHNGNRPLPVALCHRAQFELCLQGRSDQGGRST